MRLVHKQMDVLRHQDVPGNDKLVSNARCFKFGLEGAVASIVCQQAKSMVATERYEMEAAGIVKSNESHRHCG
jgi:hypothetical protein